MSNELCSIKQLLITSLNQINNYESSSNFRNKNTEVFLKKNKADQLNLLKLTTEFDFINLEDVYLQTQYTQVCKYIVNNYLDRLTFTQKELDELLKKSPIKKGKPVRYSIEYNRYLILNNKLNKQPEIELKNKEIERELDKENTQREKNEEEEKKTEKEICGDCAGSFICIDCSTYDDDDY